MQSRRAWQETKASEGKICFGGLNKRHIEEVSRSVGGIRTSYPADQVIMAMRGITRSPFASLIMKEEKARDFQSSNIG